MAMRRVFYSFNYTTDSWRAAQVRNIGAVHRNRIASGNDWESTKWAGDAAIRNWIHSQMKNRACTVVLIGSRTANRKWINYEIAQSWSGGMGVVGIRIHGLKDIKGLTSELGKNPFDYIDCYNQKLSSVVQCYNPQGNNSQEKYSWIKDHLSDAIEEAIEIRRMY